METTEKKSEEQLRSLLENAVISAQKKGKLPETEMPSFNIEVPADRANGDLSSNIAMASARLFRQSPLKTAAVLTEELNLDGTYFEKAETAGPGFMNFTLNQSYYADILFEAEKKGADYGKSDIGKGKTAIVEFVSANPTGPMHIGNARGGAIGDCLAETLTWAGYDTTREFYVNDAGNQINKFGMSLDLRYRELYGEKIEMPEDSYHGQDIIDHAKNFAAIYGDKYLSEPEEVRKKALVDYALPINIKNMESDLLKYRIKFDNWFKESSLHENKDTEKVVNLLTERGYTYEKDGAIWFKGEQFGLDKDFVLKRSNGFFTYIGPDIAYHYNKLVTRNFDRAVNVFGADHHGYVPRLKAALKACGADPDKLEVVLMQMVRLVKDGETIKASKRSGKAITLVTLLDEVPVDAARFFFNLREADTHCDFDLDLAVKESSENPVYYCQYAYARICSIFRNMAEKGITFESCSKKQAELLSSPEEKELIRHIASLTHVVESAAMTDDPSKITKYAIDLASYFHKFYNACRVDVENADLRTARLFLCKETGSVMKNVLGLMKINAPEKM